MAGKNVIVMDELEYIKRYWKRILCYQPEDKGVLIGLPNPFISPNHKIFKDDLWYWDSYFQNLGLIESGKIGLARGIVENLEYLYIRFGFIPSRNRYYDVGLSQPPFLTSMILDIYGVTKDRTWLRRMTSIVEDELKNFWMAKTYHGKEGHLVFEGLSRYIEHFYTHVTAEHESGWDMTSRYKENCMNYLSVDLNSLLYKYETDLKKIFTLLGNSTKVRKYSTMARKRRKTMIKLMWAEKRGLFFDYNYKRKLRSRFYSLAGYYPMWAGIPNESMAKQMVKNLRKFEYRGGLANTQKEELSRKFKQWDYPNGWPNQQWIVIQGLLRYGYEKDAKRIARKWLSMNKRVFERTGKFWEKYNVVSCRIGKSGVYPTQPGFGWTNAIYLKLNSMFKK
jgi:alpha,alpha-trehalase